MAIYVTSGIGPRRTGEDILQYCQDERLNDSTYDIPFEVIELEWVRRTRRVAENQRMHGFEDTHISVDDMNNVVFTHPPEGGTITWMRAKFGNKMIAKLQKTPHNMTMLAFHYYQGDFKVRGVHDPEVKDLADKYMKEMTPEQLAEHKAIIEGKAIDKFGNRIDPIAPEKLVEATTELAAKKRELAELDKQLEAKRMALRKRKEEALLQEKVPEKPALEPITS